MDNLNNPNNTNTENNTAPVNPIQTPYTPNRYEPAVGNISDPYAPGQYSLSNNSNPYAQPTGNPNPYAQDSYARSVNNPDPYGQNPYGQQVNNQNPYGQQVNNLNPYGQQANNQNPYFTPMNPPKEQKGNTATKLCVLSLILMYGVPAASYLISMLLGSFNIFSTAGSGYYDYGSTSFSSALSSMIEGVASMSPIAAIVLMIIVRVRFPKSIFGKVLMIVYIVSAVILVLLIIAAVVMCIEALKSC